MPTAHLQHTNPPHWHHLSTQATLEFWETDLDSGLTQAEAQERQATYGSNEIQGKSPKPAWKRFLEEFNQPLIYILLVAGLVTVVLRDWVDAGVIFGVTLINATIGFVQESKAENAIAALAQAITTEATVIRDGQKIRLNAKELVPGDVVLLASGDKVPADLRLVKVRDLQVSEAALTGESVPVIKQIEPFPPETGLADRHNMAYAGSLVTFGQASGVVVAIGQQTETGQISQLMSRGSDMETPLTRKIGQFSQTLLYVILALAALMFVVVLAQAGSMKEGFKAAVALAVSAIPEGLPAVVTVTLAIGVGRMAARHAIIRKLPAVETLGSTTVICSDKTGTLTENQMTVQALYAGNTTYQVTGVGYTPDGKILCQKEPVNLAETPALGACLTCGLLCNDSQLQAKDGQISVTGDPTEAALIVVAEKAGLTRPNLETDFPRIDGIPFESEFQYMATLHQLHDQGQRIYVKGALEAILSRCDHVLDAQGTAQILTDENRQTIEQKAQGLAAQGLRVLAFAQQDRESNDLLTSLDHSHIEQNLTFLGLQGMIDPPRPEAIAAVKTCQMAGIQIKMITGDHPLTAAAIAEKMGLIPDLQAPIYSGQQLTTLSEAELTQAVTESAVFARVAPEQKLRLVEALQTHGEVVAMTGDGVNDAPALKQADIGIAMGLSGTEVAKEAADMILTNDNFASIAAAVEEGRTVYGNLLKTIGFILPVNGGEAMTILVGVLVAADLPILPVQILWVNMVSSVALSATLAFEPKTANTMHRKPRPPHERLLTGKLLWRILVISVFNLAAVFGIFDWVFRGTDNLILARTMAVHTLVAAETFYLLSLSQCFPSLWRYLKHRTPKHYQEIAYVPLIGVACVLGLQVLFSQLPLANPLFMTQSVNLEQALICVAAGLPVILPALLFKRFAPLS